MFSDSSFVVRIGSFNHTNPGMAGYRAPVLAGRDAVSRMGSTPLHHRPMKVQDSPVFRRFWYAVMPMSALDEGPRPFRLFDQDLVVWKAGDGTLSALADRCCHRTARLSLGEVVGDRIACPYHGWQFDTGGRCRSIPQMPEFQPSDSCRVQRFHVAARYGHVWVALETPLTDIPDIGEAEDQRYRVIQEFHEVWDMSLFRLVDNWFDLAHVAFVHRGTQGDISRPVPPEEKLEELPFGLRSSNQVRVANRAEGQAYTGIAADETVRDREVTWYAPNSRKLRIHFPNGLHHIIFSTATPVGDGRILFTQMCIRNDSEQDVPAATAIAHDRRVTLEDKLVLESTDPEVPVMAHEIPEQGMRPDRAQMTARRKLRELVTSYDDRYRRAA
jgi:phenylpropionate dioxygenase-like ring-hydroxylating dioxygenase large terminal subunit